MEMPSHRWLIDRFLWVRRTYAFGHQNDYFDDPHCIGWTRTGLGGMAVLISNDSDGGKWMNTGASDTAYRGIAEHRKDKIVTNVEGWAGFRCKGRSVSAWVPAGDARWCWTVVARDRPIQGGAVVDCRHGG